jgi:excinuclease ABC subunit C
MDSTESKKLIANLPDLPGVYRMLNQSGEVIYVGKARSLKKRVSSYFQKTLSPRTQLMVSQICAVETTVTRTEEEALLLENNLIKTLTPRYNILFRDDKSYPYILITGHATPQLAMHRGALDKKNQYFGPFPNAGMVRESIQTLQKIFMLRSCEDSVFANRSRPCLLYQIKRCSAPCVNYITPESYQQDVKNAVLFLDGKEKQVLAMFEQLMQTASDEMKYEEAVIYRDRVQALRKIQEKQFISSSNTKLNADVIACVEEQGIVCINLVMIRGGHHLGDKSFFPQNARDHGLDEVIEAFLSQHYLERTIPELIVMGVQMDTAELQNTLSLKAQKKIQLITNPVKERRVWLEMATKNASLALRHKLNQQNTQEERLEALQQALDLPASVQRIECFDISHTMGEATVASCVVYENFAMRNNEYRHFNIKTAQPGDDIAAMREVLTRRYQKIAAGEGKIPDLILIDGGRAQVNAAVHALAEAGLIGTHIIGVAKGEARKPGLEQLIFPGDKKPLQLGKDHPALHLIQQIRDEAHRFAIRAHRAKRGKARTRSTLEDISGIGAKRRKTLLARFGGLKGVLEATVEQLAEVEGISRTLAEKIYQELH